jgi:hypothetical protein
MTAFAALPLPFVCQLLDIEQEFSEDVYMRPFCDTPKSLMEVAIPNFVGGNIPTFSSCYVWHSLYECHNIMPPPS